MSDADFRKWIQKQPSCLSGGFSEYVDGDGRCLAAHVRRAGKSGTAYKEEYACIPLFRAEHDLQHQQGELACLQRFAPHLKAETVEDAKAIFDSLVAVYRREWFTRNPADKPVDAIGE